MYTHLYQLLRDRAARFPNADAVGSQYELLWNTLSSRDLLTAVDRLAAELGDLVQCGDRVVFWVPNEWRTLAYYFAIWKLGGVVVPFDREMNPEAGARILASVEPRAILVGYGERPAWCQGVSLEEWWVPGSRAQAAQEVPSWTVPDEQLAALMFTSGTTGIPKGCMITHANISSQVETIPERVHLDTSSRLASILPLSHLLGLTGELYALSAGAAIHYVPSRRPADVLRVLSEQRITHMVVVPQLLTIMGRSIEQELAEKLPERALSWARALAPRLPLSARRALYWPVHQRLGGHLRMFLSGGAALPDETHQLWERLGVRIVQGYGTSECSPIVTLGSHDGRTPLGSVGKPLRNVHLKLGPDGELHVQGPNVMQGYWRDPGRTAEVLSDGWYATGDLAEIDSESNVRIIGRAKDLIAL
ncbi:MAG TPA: AMP-binding protein, partial [Chloroflexota bacterium]|nr:AMP-binding protein [Chloroflexota bacterium]